MTASIKPSKIIIMDHGPLQKRKSKVETVVITGHMQLFDLSRGQKSVYNQAMDDSTDTSSITSSADSTIASSVVYCSPSEMVGSTTSTAPRKGALRRHSDVPSRLLRQDKGDRHRIHFNTAVQQQLHLALHEYTTEELNACWFQGEEYAEIARSCRKQITMLEQQDCLQHDTLTLDQEDEKYCFRGLESHVRLAALAKSQNRRGAWDAVLDKQCDQVFLGVLDDEAMASRYRDVSSSCQLWAVRIAQQDQRVAEFLEYDDIAHTTAP